MNVFYATLQNFKIVEMSCVWNYFRGSNISILLKNACVLPFFSFWMETNSSTSQLKRNCFPNSFRFHLSIVNHCPSIHTSFQPYSSSSFLSVFMSLHLATRMLPDNSIYPSTELIFYQQNIHQRLGDQSCYPDLWDEPQRLIVNGRTEVARVDPEVKDAWHLTCWRNSTNHLSRKNYVGIYPFPLEVPQTHSILREQIRLSPCFLWLSQHFGRRPSFPFSDTSLKQGKDVHKGTRIPHVVPDLKSPSDVCNGP